MDIRFKFDAASRRRRESTSPKISERDMVPVIFTSGEFSDIVS